MANDSVPIARQTVVENVGGPAGLCVLDSGNLYDTVYGASRYVESARDVLHAIVGNGGDVEGPVWGAVYLLDSAIAMLETAERQAEMANRKSSVPTV